MIDYQNIIEALAKANLVICNELDMVVVGSTDAKALKEIVIELGMIRYKVKKLRAMAHSNV